MQEMSAFTQTILEQKYLWKEKGEKTWEDVARRVTKHVMKSVNVKMTDTLAKDVFQAIKERKFIPGGRYLYAAGRPFHQVQNCLLLKVEDSREAWADLMQKATVSLMTGAGIGVDYSSIRPEGKLIRKTGGVSTGPLALMEMVNRAGSGVMQGGSRRSAIWAGLSWKHADIHKFVNMKNWTPEVRALKEKDFNFPAVMDGTNISVQLDDDFFEAFDNEKHILHSHAQSVYWATIRQMLKTGEPGFSVDVGDNKNETLRNACVTGETEILTKDGHIRIDSVVDQEVEVWNGFEWSKVTPKITGYNQDILRVELDNGQWLDCTPYHKFHIATDYYGGTKIVEAGNLEAGMKLIKHEFPTIDDGVDLKDSYTQGFVAAEGMELDRTLYVYPPKKMCLDRLQNVKQVKWEENNNRHRVLLQNTPVSKSYVPLECNLRSKLEWLSGLFDGDGTELKEGGLQLVSINKEFLLNVQKLLTLLGVTSKVKMATKAGYRKLPDGRGGHRDFYCQDSYRILIGAVQMQRLKRLGLNCSRMVFDKNPQRDASQFVKICDVIENGKADVVYCFNEPKRHMGVFNGIITGQCTEVTSRDDSDICNLGSINLARVNSTADMARIVEIGTAFLLAGTIYSDVPYAKVDQVRTKNRRLGLGLMGLHEWLLQHGKQYGPDSELEEYLKIYATSTKIARRYADEWDLSHPVKTRAVAPVGTIGIIGETSTGAEPIFCAAYKRRYKKGLTETEYQYVLDPTAKRLVDNGLDPDKIEDAYTLAENVERRVAFQAWLQQYVDHGISSTINLPAWGSELNNDNKVVEFGNMLIKYLPKLRGITCYPDGARAGQPLTPVKYREAEQFVGQKFIESADICDITKGGSCGS